MSSKQDPMHDALAAFWDENMLEPVESSLESTDDSSIDDPVMPLDSITACDALIDIERIVGRKLPVEKIVRKGGYSSKEDFINDITEAVTEFLSTNL